MRTLTVIGYTFIAPFRFNSSLVTICSGYRRTDRKRAGTGCLAESISTSELSTGCSTREEIVEQHEMEAVVGTGQGVVFQEIVREELRSSLRRALIAGLRSQAC